MKRKNIVLILTVIGLSLTASVFAESFSQHIRFNIAKDFCDATFNDTALNNLASWNAERDTWDKNASEIVNEINLNNKLSKEPVKNNNKRNASSEIDSLHEVVNKYFTKNNLNKKYADKLEYYNKYLADKNMLLGEDILIHQHFGYVTGHKVISDTDIFTIAFRGTSDTYSWFLTDFLAWPSKFFDTETHVHTGFLWNFLSIIERSQWKNFLSEIQRTETAGKNVEVIITGHSLGGATAVLAAAYLLENKIVNKDDLYTITLAEPCPGKPDFVSRYKQKFNNENYATVINLFDIVPFSPMVVGFIHFDFGQLYFFDSKTDRNPSKRHNFSHYAKYITDNFPLTNI